jgi:hypothetical protein
MAAKNRRGTPCVVYLHPFEMGPVVRRIEGMTWLRSFRTYVGLRKSPHKLDALVRAFPFVRVIDYLQARQWLARPA